MSNAMLDLLLQQADLSEVSLMDESLHPVFKVKQTLDQGARFQRVRVLTDISNTYAIKRQKDLWHYLNQYGAFLRFNEIRKVGMAYLQFFDVGGKRTLAQQVAKKGVLSSKTAKKVLLDTLLSLQKLHEVGFVHTAIRPEHILLGKNQAYLLGIEHAMAGLSSYETERFNDDALYWPPERLNGEFDEKGDVYALGCTLYFALTGQPIYKLRTPKNPKQVWKNAWAQVYHSMRVTKAFKKLSPFWRDLMVWMTQKQPSNRPGLVDIERALMAGKVPKTQNISTKNTTPQNALTPKSPLQALADAHYLMPMFHMASHAEAQDEWFVAISLYENAAFKGFAHAATRLGELYETGQQVKQSYAMAANFYQQAVAKGHPYAATCLARLFEHGLGMAVNLEQAHKWYKFAALRGDAKAQRALAGLLQEGLGTSKNPTQALAWNTLAEHSECIVEGFNVLNTVR
jgi:hypothetical protein